MAGGWAVCFGRGSCRSRGDRPAETSAAAAVAGQGADARAYSHERGKGAVGSTVAVLAGGADAAPATHPTEVVDVAGNSDVEGACLAVSTSVGARLSPPVDLPAIGCTAGGRTPPAAATAGGPDHGVGAAKVSVSGATELKLSGAVKECPVEEVGNAREGQTDPGDAGGAGSASAAPEHGYSLSTFRVWPCVSGKRGVSRTRNVYPGQEVCASLGRNLYVLWKSPRGKGPESVEAFRAAGPTCIRLERGVGVLRSASQDEAVAAGVAHTGRLLFVRGTELCSVTDGGNLSDVALLLEAPSPGVCVDWAGAGSSLVLSWKDLVASHSNAGDDAARARELLRSVFPLPAATANAQPGVVSRMLHCRGRRWVLSAHYRLQSAAPTAAAVGSVIRTAAEAVDAATGVPAAGLALRVGLLGVQVGALAVLAEGCGARRRAAVERCEGVAHELLGCVIQELQEDRTEIGDAFVNLLCAQMGPVEGVLEAVERTFFVAPGSALTDVVVSGWEEQLLVINQWLIDSRVRGALGRGINRLEKRVSILGRAVAAPSSEEDKLSKYRAGWRPPPVRADYVAGVDNPGRAEYAIISTLQQYADRRGCDSGIKVPRVGICAIGGSGKSTACAGVAASERVRQLFPRGTVWVQLNESSSIQTVADAAVALAMRFCGEPAAKDLLRLCNRHDFLEVAAARVWDADRKDAAESLVVVDNVLADKKEQLLLLLRIIPRAVPVLFTTRAEDVVAAVRGAERVAIESLPEADARVLLAEAVGKRPAQGQSVFSDHEEAALVQPVLEKTRCHALSLSIVTGLIADRTGEWQPVVAELARNQLKGVRAMLNMTLTLLPDAACRDAFEALSILPANDLVGVHVLERLWRPLLGGRRRIDEGVGSLPATTHVNSSGGVHPDVIRHVGALARVGLLRREVAAGKVVGVVLHPVICDYSRCLLSADGCRAAHQRVLDDYAGGSPTDGVDEHGWRDYEFWATPDDDYWYNNVARHAAASGNVCALVSLTCDEWRDARVRTTSALALQVDLERVIEALQAVVDDSDQAARTTAVLHGIMHQGLAVAYTKRNRGSRPENLNRAITLLKRALELVPRATAPRHWAKTQHNLGVAHTNRVGGNRADNVKAAMSCYHLALDVRTREAAPLDWAKTQCNLGLAYSNRVGGDRAANVKMSMECYRLALGVNTLEAAPLDWAMTQCNLGNAYTDRVGGNRAANIEAAMECYRRSLEVMTNEAAPLDWAKTQVNLGNAYSIRLDGHRRANFEAAMACYRLALEVYTREATPWPWAKTHCNLGNAYSNCVDGDCAANLEAAMASYRLALEVNTREAAPLDWAAIQHSLGVAHSNRVDGDRATNVEAAMACYHLALEVRTRETAPLEWAMTQHNMGIAYIDRVGGDRAANIEAAMVCYYLALEVNTREAAPLDWARTQHNLGVAHSNRVGGDRAADVEAAMTCYRLALEVRTRETSPMDWARTQYNLGISHTHRVGGDRAANVEAAMVCYRLALEVRTRKTAPLDWARTQHSLGVAYTNRVGGDRTANVEAAIACYRLSLEVMTLKRAPQHWARTQQSLGIAYTDRMGGDRAANVEAAMACYRLALEVRTREAAPLDWAATKHDIGVAYSYRVSGDRAANVKAAIACYRLALEVRTRVAAAQQWAHTSWQLLLILPDSKQWVDALATARALQAFGSEWSCWVDRETSLVTRIAALERRVALGE